MTVVLGIAASVLSTAASTPFDGIVERNVFSLKPPPPPVDPNAEKPKSPVKLVLTGITTIFGNKRALMTAQIPARPPEPARQESYMLAEGQRDGDVEVVTIDEVAGTVNVKNRGLPETLDFVNNGAKLVATAAPGGAPAAGGAAPQMGMRGAPPLAAAGGGMRTIPPRQVRTQQQPPAAPNQGQQVQPNMGFAAGPTGAVQPRPATDITPEEQTIMFEAQRMHFQQQGKQEEANLLPPTELTPPQQSDVPAPF